MGESIRAEHLPPREKIHPRGRRSTHEEEDPPARWKGPPCGGKPPSSRGRIRPREGGSACTVADRPARGEDPPVWRKGPLRGENPPRAGGGSTLAKEDDPPLRRRICLHGGGSTCAWGKDPFARGEDPPTWGNIGPPVEEPPSRGEIRLQSEGSAPKGEVPGRALRSTQVMLNLSY